jgi:hypothetical protein
MQMRGARWGEALEWYENHVDLDTNECIIFPFVNPKPFVRMACRRYNGLSDGLFACHGPCNNKFCINHKHLSWQTNSENQLDRYRDGNMFSNYDPDKGYDNYGENNGQSKLTEQKVLEIKELSKSISRKELAIMFNISYSHLNSLIRGAKWSYLLPSKLKGKDLFS